MAKEKRPVADLDAELAALEAELAALEGRKPAPRRSPPPAPAAPVPPPAMERAPAEERPEPVAEKRSRIPFGRKREPAPVETSAPPVAEKKARFGFGRRKDAHAEAPPLTAAPAPMADDVPPLVAAYTPTTPPRAAAPIPVTDPTPWRQEESGAWVRVVHGSPTPVVRRILDEEDRVVREEPADAAALREISGAGLPEGAEKGFGRLFRRRS